MTHPKMKSYMHYWVQIQVPTLLLTTLRAIHMQLQVTDVLIIIGQVHHGQRKVARHQMLLRAKLRPKTELGHPFYEFDRRKFSGEIKTMKRPG
jgi:hypothetical protein